MRDSRTVYDGREKLRLARTVLGFVRSGAAS